MNCKTCELPGHDSQGDARLCVQAAAVLERRRCVELVTEVLDRHDIWHGAPQACISIVREIVPKALAHPYL